jgi:hypothetical protein
MSRFESIGFRTFQSKVDKCVNFRELSAMEREVFSRMAHPPAGETAQIKESEFRQYVVASLGCDKSGDRWASLTSPVSREFEQVLDEIGQMPDSHLEGLFNEAYPLLMGEDPEKK